MSTLTQFEAQDKAQASEIVRLTTEVWYDLVWYVWYSDSLTTNVACNCQSTSQSA